MDPLEPMFHGSGDLTEVRGGQVDVMHRPIGPSVPRVSMDDIPRPLRLNAMLHELLAVLRTQGNTH